MPGLRVSTLRFYFDFSWGIWWQLTGVNNVHGTHGAAGVVEDPFLVEVHVGFGRGGLQVGHDIGDDGASVVAMLCDCALCEVV